MEVPRKIKKEDQRLVAKEKARRAKEFDRSKRRVIREIARLMYKEKKPLAEIWDELNTKLGWNSELLVERMRALIIKKLFKLSNAEDNLDNVSKSTQLSVTEWLLYDLLLVHENIDVIGQDFPDKHEPKFLKRLLELVVEFDLETSSGESLVKNWLQATAAYNNNGKRQCSPMLLQKRWHQLKELSRNSFYRFWFEYRGDARKLEKAKAYKPTGLQMDVVKMFKTIVTDPFLSWEDLVKEKKVALPEDFERMRIEETKILSENEPDLLVIEPHIETIDLDDRNDESNGSTNNDKVDNADKGDWDIGMVKVESLADEYDISVLESVHIPLENTEIGVRNNDAITKYTEINVIESNEENMPKIKSVISSADFEPDEQLYTRDESVSSVIEIEPTLIINEANAISEQVVTKNDKVEHVQEKKKNSNPEETYELTKKLKPDSNNGTEKSDRVFKKIEVKQIRARAKFLNCQDAKDIIIDLHYDMTPEQLAFLSEGIVFQDDGIDFINEDPTPVPRQEKQKPSDNNDKKEEKMQIDQKFLLAPVVFTKKLDDMDVFRFIDYSSVNDMRVLENAYVESKPIYAKYIKNKKILKHRQAKEIPKTVSPEPIASVENKEKDGSVITLASWYFRKPKVKSYNPIQLCKNPDFNKRLNRLPAAFFISERNRSMLKSCKPLTIDLHKSFERVLVDNTVHLNNTQKYCIEEPHNEIPVTFETDPPEIIECTDDKQNENKEITPEDQLDPHIERNKVINLLDIDKIRRVNQGLKVAEVSPIVVSNTVLQTDNVKAPSSLLRRTVVTSENSLLLPRKAAVLPKITAAISEISLPISQNSQNSLVVLEKTSTLGKSLTISENSCSIPDNTSTSLEKTLTQPESNDILPALSNEGFNDKNNMKSVLEVEVITQTDSVKSIESSHESIDIEERARSEINIVHNVARKGIEPRKRKPLKAKRKPHGQPTMALSWYPKTSLLNQNPSDCLLAADTVERILCVCNDDYIPSTNKKKKKKIVKARKLPNKGTISLENQNEKVSNSSVASEKNVKNHSTDKSDIRGPKAKKCKIKINNATTNIRNVCCWSRQRIKRFPKINIGKHLCPQYNCVCCCKTELDIKINEEKMKYKARVRIRKRGSKVSVGINTEYDIYFESQFAANLRSTNHQSYTGPPITRLPFGDTQETFSKEVACQTIISVPSMILPSPRRVRKYKNDDNTITDQYKLPICLGKNNILLCSFKSIDITSDQRTLGLDRGSESVLPNGCQLVLLPNLQITWSIDPVIQLDEEELSKVQNIISSIEKESDFIQTDNTGKIPAAENPALSDEIVIEIPDNETPNLTTLNLNSEARSSNSMEVNWNNVNYHSDKSTTERQEDTVPNTGTPNLTDGSESHTPTMDVSDTLVTNRKTLLSDLMEMSGISADDVNDEDNTNLPKIVNVSSLSQSLPPATSTELQRGFQNTSRRITSGPIFTNAVVQAAISRCPELNIVSTVPELTYAYKNKAQFFKMDINTGIIVPITINRFCVERHNSRKAALKKNLPNSSESIIDLTDETDYNDTQESLEICVTNPSEIEQQSDFDCVTNPSEIEQQSDFDCITNPSEIEQQSDRNCGEKIQNEIENPNERRPVKPIKMFKTIHPSILRHSGKSLLVYPIKKSNTENKIMKPPTKQKRKQEILVKDIDSEESSNSSFTEETESGFSSDNEPLSKKSKRIKGTLPNKYYEIEDQEMLKGIFSIVDYNSRPRLEPIVFDDSDSVSSEDDCILGF